MTEKSRAELDEALRNAVEALNRRIAENAPAEVIKVAFETLKTFEELARRKRRLRDLSILVALVGLGLAVCGVASLIHARNPGVALSAQAVALTVEIPDSGLSSQISNLPMLRTASATSLWLEREIPSKPLCTSPDSMRPGCEIVQAISIIALTPTPGMKARFTVEDSCIVTNVSDGFLRLNYVALQLGVTEIEPKSIVLGSKDRLRFCTAVPLRLTIYGVQSLIVAAWNDVPAAYLPSLVGGSFRFSGFGKEVSLRRSDTLSIDFKAEPGPLTMELRDAQLSVDIAGDVESAILTNESGPRDVRPVWLDWLLQSPMLHAALSLTFGLFAFAWGLREKLAQ